MLNRTSALAFFSLLLVACSDNAVAPIARPDCEAIVERCHPLDPGTGPIHECHEAAESAATTNAMCTAQRASCFATCVATDSGVADAAADVTDAAVPNG